MTNRRFTVPALAALVLTMLFVPAAASAQSSIWDRIRDRARDEQRRDRDEDWRRGRRDRDDDYGRGRGGRMSDYDRRRLRDLARRIEDRSQSFQRNLDRSLDRSRIDDTRREDNINELARDFRNAADRFRNVAGDNDDLYRSQDEAQQLLQLGSRVERVIGRVRLDSRTASDWSQIRADLRTVADIYRLGNYGNGGYGRGRGRGNRNGYPW
jgi:hypothetical protein